MKHLLTLFLVFSFLPLFASPTPKREGVDFQAIEKELSGPGVIGWVHGAVSSYEQYVFTYRNPDNFFDHYEFPLTTDNPLVKKELSKLTRHDKVKVKGVFIASSAPIKHISAAEVTVITHFENGMGKPPYEHEAKLPSDLEGKTELVGKVHAIVNEGKILVIEYKDAVIPVYVTDTKFTKDLFRNDTIKMKYVIRKHPHSPSHVSLNTNAENPLTVLNHLVEMHGKEGFVEGYLILFPKSPQVIFNVFALQKTDEFGVKREYTLLNFDDPKVFEAIRIKLQEYWDSNTSNIKDARNKFINLNIKLRATGTFNVVDPGQANPQIILASPESITLAK